MRNCIYDTIHKYIISNEDFEEENSLLKLNVMSKKSLFRLIFCCRELLLRVLLDCTRKLNLIDSKYLSILSFLSLIILLEIKKKKSNNIKMFYYLYIF